MVTRPAVSAARAEDHSRGDLDHGLRDLYAWYLGELPRWNHLAAIALILAAVGAMFLPDLLASLGQG